ncbi:MAG: selenium-dependent xanthine dehydrogenase, partial [Myxococcales bacterium]|nr:selenium-dependent xanthine dehydrogenase [Myxococcales bacterium]
MREPTQTVSFTLNGTQQEVTIRDGETLLETLRERCGIKSTKDGCSPQGQCGCCLALIDGNPKVSCATPAAKVDGKEILTLEGLTDAERDATARAFVAAAGLQCGFCIPGFALRAKNLLDKNPSPTRDEIAKAIDVHLCRCTGYVKIIDAIELMAAERRGEAKPELCTDGKVGDSLARYRGLDLVLGDRDYVDDMRPEGLLFGHVVLSAHARAKVLAIDTSAAEAMEGVVRVATAADVPGERFYGLIHADWPGLVAVGEEVKCVGDVLAVVAAQDARTAREAAAAVNVDYEVLEAITDPEDALRDGAARANRVMPNQLSRSHIERGDVAAALAASAHVVEERFETQRIEHLYLEPESALCVPLEGGKLRLYTQGQGIFDDQRQVAAFLGIPESDLDVELVPNGGAFGGKEDMSVQAHASLMALLTQRPVKITLTREQSIRLHPKRHPIKMSYRVGCDADGRLTAVQADMVGDTGAYASVGAKVLERAAGHACGPYRVDNVRVTAVAAYTNNPPCGAMRGFGANQAHFAMESCMDMLAEKVGIDPFEMRWRNALEVGDVFSTGQVLDKSVGIKKTLAAVKDAYYAARNAGKAVGIGCGLKNSGIGNGAIEWGKTRIVVEEDDTISIYNGFTEMGQGLLTLMIQFAVDVTGLDPKLFRPKIDSTFQLGCGQTTGSRATLLGGRSVLAAAEKLKAALDSGKSLSELRGQVFAADIKVDDTTKLGVPAAKIKTHTAFGFATQVCILDEAGKLERFIAAHDVGKAVNPALCEGQIEGSVHMGLGFALTEDLPCEDGMPVTFKLREIGVLRARDMPAVEVILVEEHEPEGPRGAKGVGEIGLVP